MLRRFVDSGGILLLRWKWPAIALVSLSWLILQTCVAFAHQPRAAGDDPRTG